MKFAKILGIFDIIFCVERKRIVFALAEFGKGRGFYFEWYGKEAPEFTGGGLS